MDSLDSVKWGPDGLVPAIAQEAGSKDVLMLAWMNREALAATVQRGQAVYYSRSRGRLWHKGEASGNFQQVHDIRIDCDADVILLTVHAAGARPIDRLPHRPPQLLFPAPGRRRLDQRRAGAAGPGDALRRQGPGPAGMNGSGNDTLARLAEVIASRRGGDPEKSYVARLFFKGPDAILKKIGEEATEVVMAAKDGDRPRIVAEVADLWFHTLLALSAFDLTPADVLAELQRREGQSGLEEFALRKAQHRDTESRGEG